MMCSESRLGNYGQYRKNSGGRVGESAGFGRWEEGGPQNSTGLHLATLSLNQYMWHTSKHCGKLYVEEKKINHGPITCSF